jgi:nucleoside-diphosphate-sugar epimerase
MKTILVTGGAGFLGSHLCRSLLERGDIVICLDNLSSGSEKNIESLKRNKKFQFIEHDITAPFDYQIHKPGNSGRIIHILFYRCH